MLAVLVLADLANRATDLTAHYRSAETDGEPLAGLVELDERGALLLGVGAVAALAMLVGYRTRLATVIVWVVLLSVHWRNPLVLDSGDILLRMLLFWAMFLPLGACFQQRPFSVEELKEDGVQAPLVRYISDIVAVFGAAAHESARRPERVRFGWFGVDWAEYV